MFDDLKIFSSLIGAQCLFYNKTFSFHLHIFNMVHTTICLPILNIFNSTHLKSNCHCFVQDFDLNYITAFWKRIEFLTWNLNYLAINKYYYSSSLHLKASFWGLFKTNFCGHFRKLFLFSKFNFSKFREKVFLTVLRSMCLEFCASNYFT